MNYHVAKYVKDNIQYPSLISQTYSYKSNNETPYNIFQHLKSMQTIMLPIDENYIESLFQKQYISSHGRDIIPLKKEFTFPTHLTILFFGSTNKLQINTDYYLWYKNNKNTHKEVNVNMYNVESATNIPKELKNYKLANLILNILNEITPIHFNIPNQITYTKFRQTDYMFVDPSESDFPFSIGLLMTNIPYLYYQKALILADHQICYDITKNEFQFSCRSQQKYELLLIDIAKNGFQEPLVLGINQWGCIFNTSEYRLRTLAALHLKIPLIPIIAYLMEDSTNIFSIDNRDEANKCFNPHLLF